MTCRRNSHVKLKVTSCSGNYSSLCDDDDDDHDDDNSVSHAFISQFKQVDTVMLATSSNAIAAQTRCIRQTAPISCIPCDAWFPVAPPMPTASRSVQPFCTVQRCAGHTDRRTHRLRHSVCMRCGLKDPWSAQTMKIAHDRPTTTYTSSRFQGVQQVAAQCCNNHTGIM